MKILFMIPRLTYSGAPKMMAWVANKMSESGHDVNFVTFFSDEQRPELNENIKVQSLGVEQSKNRLLRNTTGMMKTIFRLHKFVKRMNPDVVVSFLDSVGYAYLPIGTKLTKCKFVVSERVDPFAYRGKLSYVRFWLMKHADGFVFQTQGAMEFFKKYKKIYENGAVIPNPVVVTEKTLEIQKNIPKPIDREKRIVTVGRLSLPQKRQDVLLQAFKIFRENYPEYELVLYGDGQDETKIRELSDALGLSEHVIFAGRTDRVEEEIFNASAFVLTSDFEGIPNALIEAMSLGVPSIATDCSPGGASLLIKDGVNGFLVQRGDAKAIAEKLSVLIDDFQVSEKFSQNGLSIVNEFSEIVIADKWKYYFESVLHKRFIE